MSSTYRKIEYPCDCGYNYGDCEHTNLLMYWDFHTNGQFMLYAREHGVWRRVITLEGREPLLRLLTEEAHPNDDENPKAVIKPLSPEDWVEFEKVRHGQR